MFNKTELLTALKQDILDHQINDELIIDEVVIDSRTTTTNSLFIAIIGPNNNGHDYLKMAQENGAKLLLVSDIKNLPKNSNYILVKDTYQAMYHLAKYCRERSSAKIVALTGSVGKTSTKELLKISLSKYGKTYATKGNLNNHYGVALTLCNFSRDNKFGIFEIGMNHLNEITPLSKLVRPDIAIITNVGPVHIENFKNEQEIAKAKSEIFAGLQSDGFGLINSDNQHFSYLQKQFSKNGNKNLLTFGENNQATYQLLNYQIKNINLSQVTIKIKDQIITYDVPTSKKVNIFNSIIAASVIHHFNNKTDFDFSKHIEGKGRGQISNKIINDKNITIIDDSYNASLPAIIAGLKYSLEIKNSLNKKRVVIALGDMLELGQNSAKLHQEIAENINLLKIDFAILVGKEMPKISTSLDNNNFATYPDSISASHEIKNHLQDGDILYVKGSRGLKMEEIINNLN